MTVGLEKVPKAVQALPEDGQRMWVDAYNHDFGWRCSESHAEKAAWRAVYQAYDEQDGTWTKKG